MRKLIKFNKAVNSIVAKPLDKTLTISDEKEEMMKMICNDSNNHEKRIKDAVISIVTNLHPDISIISGDNIIQSSSFSPYLFSLLYLPNTIPPRLLLVLHQQCH